MAGACVAVLDLGKTSLRVSLVDEDGGSRSELHVMDWQTGESRPYVTSPEGVRSIRGAPKKQPATYDVLVEPGAEPTPPARPQ